MNPAHDPSRYVRVACPVCKAVLHPRVEKAGHHVRCPDCHSAVLVPQPPKPEQAKPLRDPGQYAVVEGNRQVVEPECFPLLCPTCHARLHPRVSQIGKRIKCPDCDMVFVVAAPPPADVIKPLPTPGQYGVGDEPVRAEATLEFLVVQGTLPPEPLAPPPRRWFASGVFNFPWSTGAASRWGALSLLAIPFGEMCALVAFLSGVLGPLGGGLSYASTLIPILMAPTAWLAFWTLSYAAACFLPIVQDTASGNAEVISWSEGDWRDRIGPLLYVAFEVLLACSAGSAAGWAIGHWQGALWGSVAMVLVSLLVFPIVLLSALEADAPFLPYSPVILRSLTRLWWAWLVVYLELACTVGGALALTAAGLFWSPFVSVFFASPLLATALFIAGRLIGRLAWRIGEEESAAARKKKKRKKKESEEIVAVE